MSSIAILHLKNIFKRGHESKHYSWLDLFWCGCCFSMSKCRLMSLYSNGPSYIYYTEDGMGTKPKLEKIIFEIF